MKINGCKADGWFGHICVRFQVKNTQVALSLSWVIRLCMLPYLFYGSDIPCRHPDRCWGAPLAGEQLHSNGSSDQQNSQWCCCDRSLHLAAQFLWTARLSSDHPRGQMINPSPTPSCADELTGVNATPVQLVGDLFTHHRAVFKEVLIEYAHPQVLIENLGAFNHRFNQITPEQPAAIAA